jgi:hypothetical protein
MLAAGEGLVQSDLAQLAAHRRLRELDHGWGRRRGRASTAAEQKCERMSRDAIEAGTPDSEPLHLCSLLVAP